MAMRFGDEDADLEAAHEINVTPFIDVMLVLLIIFMVAAPLSTVDMPVELPASNASAAPPPDDALHLTLKADLTLEIEGSAVPLTAAAQALDAASGGDRDALVLVRGDRSVPYGDLMNVLNELRGAGYRHVALTGIEQGGAP